ncbi:MAG: hypothetical protein IJ859_04775 [Synergistaceae bacterium]|nr:hypothetical protein [Synergistaceae bacterium]
MEELALFLGIILFTVFVIFVLGIATMYVLMSLVSFGLKLQEEKKENPDKDYITFFKVNAILHLTTALLIIAHLGISIVEN